MPQKRAKQCPTKYAAPHGEPVRCILLLSDPAVYPAQDIGVDLLIVCLV